jgi:hypothetical protein
VADVVTHGAIGILGAAFDNRGGDDAVIGIGGPDTFRGVERCKQQTVDGYREPEQELGHIVVARTGDDQPMPGVVELGEAPMIVLALVQLALDCEQTLPEFGVGPQRALGGCQAFKGHARAVDLPDLVETQPLHRSAAEFLQRQQAIGFQSLQGFADLAAAGAGCGHDVGLDQALARHQPSVPDAFTYPFDDVGGATRRGFLRTCSGAGHSCGTLFHV